MLKGWHFGPPCDSYGNKLTMNLPVTNTTETTIKTICQDADSRSHREFLLDHNKKSQQKLNKSEKCIKVGFACLILKYFNVLSAVQKEKKRWTVESETSSTAVSIKKENHLSKERLLMIEEEKNVSHRQQMMSFANEKV